MADGDADHLTVFMEGTANTLQPITTQVGLFFEHTDAADVTGTETSIDLDSPTPLRLKMGYDGCGVTNGIAGVIWAFGLASQCDRIMVRIQTILASKRTRPLCVTALGLSRGGIGALMLAQRLGALAEGSRNRLRLSLCLFDPVPGNLVNTVRYLDLPGWSTARQVMDISQSPARSVLAIYPTEPLPDLAFHAPILPRYPDACEVDEDATLGCHQGALYPPRARMPAKWRAGCELSQHRVLSFLEQCGVRLSLRSDECAAQCLAVAEHAAQQHEPTTRVSHAWGGVGHIVRHPVGTGQCLLNRHHLMLLRTLSPTDSRAVVSPSMTRSSEPPFLLAVSRPSSDHVSSDQHNSCFHRAI